MAESIVSVAATKLTDLLAQEARYLGGVQVQVKQLQTELQLMQTFLRDADARQAESETMRQYLIEIRNIAYDIEDVIETFDLKIASKRREGCRNAIKRYVCILKEGRRLHNIRSQIEGIRGRIGEWTRRLQTYGIRKSTDGESSRYTSSQRQRRERRRSYPHLMEENVVGFDDKIEELVSVLGDNRETSIRVVAICGMGGIGKTTLAKKVYKRLREGRCFDHFAWVYVSRQFEKENVWKGILSCFGLDKDQTVSRMFKREDPQELADKLHNFLRAKKCLVVLDDIWSTQAWDILQPSFPAEETNTKILLTSRNTAVALHADPRPHIHQLECLDDATSRDLFQKTAFPRGQYSPSPDNLRLEELGRKMVKHCAGLPLAITVLGGVLATKYGSYNDWQLVHDDVKSYIRRGRDYKVQDMLSLSYDDLPSYLKPCFLYLAHFPEDHEIDADALIHMWIAEGFVSQAVEEDGRVKMEDEAENYLIELLQRNMIRVIERDATMKIKRCHVHDLMRDFCLSKAREESFLYVMDLLHRDLSAAGISNVRGLAVHGVFWVLGINSIPHLRSFLYFDSNLDSNLDLLDAIPEGYHWFRRAISHLERINWEVNSCTDFIVRIFVFCAFYYILRKSTAHLFKHFKKLRVFQANQLLLGGVLDNIGNLFHLRYLCLAQSDLTKMPPSVGKLRCLQTLDLRDTSDIFLVRIPGGIWKLGQLRHLYLPERCHDKTKFKLGNLRNLQTLVNFPVNNSRSIESLLRMKNLRELRICGAIQVNRRALRCLNYVLDICGCSVVEQDYAMNVGVEEDPMPVLEKLPNLKILAVEKGAFMGKKMVVSAAGFPLLEALELHSLPGLEELSVAEGAMPRLCQFHVDDCLKLKVIPPQLRRMAPLAVPKCP